jgi:biotin transport system substrate-specific component
VRGNITGSVAAGIPAAMASDRVMRLARIMLFVAFTAVGAQLAVRLPFTPVPVTLQTLFVVLAGLVLGPRDGFYAMSSYLVIGALGAPVFAGFGFGPAAILGPTGGYLIAFPAAALAAGSLPRLLPGRASAFAGAVLGSSLILAMGSLHLALILRMPLVTAFALGAVPFAMGELAKAVVATVLIGRR